MLKDSKAFSGFSVDDFDAAHAFYADRLGLDVTVHDESMGLLSLDLTGGGTVMIYAKDSHQPATYTVLNFPVDDVEKAVDRAHGQGRRVRTVRRLRPGRARDLPGARTAHRVVHRPRGQRAVGSPGSVGVNPEADCRWVVEQLVLRCG
ncbi:MAG TPA: VOC family protein [Nocardioides sp.]|nr:VOC family protein [Nocardioides sp.]